MKIKIMNVYNTQSIGKTSKKLNSLVKKHLKEIKNTLSTIDPEIKFTLESINYVDWRDDNRGEDIRFYLNIEKQGRKITARKIYQVCNENCLRPCYFS